MYEMKEISEKCETFENLLKTLEKNNILWKNWILMKMSKIYWKK